ncbi:MAG: hypothetical protein IT467_03345 [Dokdonella sp.]|uniref:hypothetical protein n=1 Tax=Dokdonella sp. TaxID=2291710 RepID=UPI0025B8FC52|nr:hypothetical protein [Dokdonella sp.]MBZ0223833.1 hypothetical protein [Dokdonella sp.]MCC7254947.1 hypothetical protein [Dokdonella sp.]
MKGFTKFILRLLVPALLILPFAAAAQESDLDQEKHVEDTAFARFRAEQTLLAGPNDLAVDWQRTLWPSDTDSWDQRVLAVRRSVCAGFATCIYVLMSEKQAVSPWGFNVVVTRLNQDGTTDISFGTAGYKRLTLGSAWDSIEGAVFEDSGILAPQRAFFIGTKWTPDSLFGKQPVVTCMDFGAADGKCSGWPAANHSSRSVAFHGSGEEMDYGRAIAYDAEHDALWVAGDVLSHADGDTYVAWIGRLNAADGTRYTAWGSRGDGTTVLSASGKKDMHVTSVLYHMSTYPGGPNVWLGGSWDQTTGASNREGVVWKLNPEGPGGFVKSIGYEDDNTGNKDDEITALALTNTGKVLAAGWSGTDDPVRPALLLAKLRNAGVIGVDSSFCGGGICAHAPSGFDKFLAPRAIAERPGNHDIVVASDVQGWLAVDLGAYQRVDLWSRSGNTLHALERYQADAQTDADKGAGVGAGALDVFGNELYVGGYRHWAGDDYDGMVSRHLALDSIFADDFGSESLGSD